MLPQPTISAGLRMAASSPTCRREVYVRPFPQGDKLFQISTDGGEAPTWCADGEIFYLANDRLLAVSVRARGDDLEISKPTVLIDLDNKLVRRAFDAAADGQSFLMLRSNVEERISVIFNWPKELARISREGSRRSNNPRPARAQREDSLNPYRRAMKEGATPVSTDLR
jgi:hypothetical protein